MWVSSRWLDMQFTHITREIRNARDQIMATVEQGLADLKQEIADLGTQMDTNFQALKDALAANDPAKAQAIADELEADVQALKDIGTRDSQTSPATPDAPRIP